MWEGEDDEFLEEAQLYKKKERKNTPVDVFPFVPFLLDEDTQPSPDFNAKPDGQHLSATSCYYRHDQWVQSECVTSLIHSHNDTMANGGDSQKKRRKNVLPILRSVGKSLHCIQDTFQMH